MKKIALSIVAIIILIAAAAGIAWQQFGLAILSPMEIDSDFRLDVAAGSSVNAVFDQLAETGAIDDTFWPRLYVRLNPEMAAIKAGSYTLPQPLNVSELLALLVAGQADLERVTLIEGWTAAQALDALLSHPDVVNDLGVELLRRADGAAWLSDAEHKRLSDRLGIGGEFLEGWLFPDTYRFVSGTPLSTLLMLSHERMREQLEITWVSRADNLPLTDPYALLTLASIVEKETGLESERDIIAGVFTRRLDKKMRLQTDPTVIYGIGVDYDGDIRRRDLNNATRYNTYQMSGLPPTPIALPGLASLRAAAQPAAGVALFFVASGNNDGSHVFSSTNAEHEKAVAEFLRKSAQR